MDAISVGDYVELLEDSYALYTHSEDGHGCYLQKGLIGKVTELYEDQGFWSDGNPILYESPFPAATILFHSIGKWVCSIHVKILKKTEDLV